MDSKPKQYYMGVDQYGNTFHGLIHPRKDLIDKLGGSSAKKVYIDKKDGSTKHVGYIVNTHWVTLYEVTPFEREA
jgi:hypothetical protein